MTRKGWSLWKRTETGFVSVEPHLNLYETGTKMARQAGKGKYRLCRNDGSKQITIKVNKDGEYRVTRTRKLKLQTSEG